MVVGFTVGAVDRSKLLDRSAMKAGDVIIALPSTGVHSNGFSLVRKVFHIGGENWNPYVAELGMTLGEALLTPTKIYVKPMLALMEAVTVKGVAHITGGGFYENIPRCLKQGLSAKIEKSAVRPLPIFPLIQQAGNIPERDMYNTFNMGVGMMAVVSAEDADTAVATLKQNGIDAYVLGELTVSEEGVILC